MLGRIILWFSRLTTLSMYAGACAKALAPFSGVAAALARILRPGTGLIMLFRQEVSAAPEWLIIAAAIALLQIAARSEALRENAVAQQLAGAATAVFAACTLQVFGTALRPLTYTYINWWTVALAVATIVKFLFQGPSGMCREMGNTAPAALRNTATIGFFFACACAPWLAAAFVFNPVAGNVLNQLLGLALLGCFYEVVTKGIALTSGHNESGKQDDNLKLKHEKFADKHKLKRIDDEQQQAKHNALPWSWQKLAAFVIACALTNALVHTFDWDAELLLQRALAATSGVVATRAARLAHLTPVAWTPYRSKKLNQELSRGRSQPGLAAVIALGPFDSTETAAAISKAIPRSTAMTVLFAKYLGRAEVWRIAAAAVIALEKAARSQWLGTSVFVARLVGFVVASFALNTLLAFRLRPRFVSTVVLSDSSVAPWFVMAAGAFFFLTNGGRSGLVDEVWDRQDKSYLGQTLAVNILVGTLLCAPTWYTAYIFNPIWRGWNQHVFGLLATATAYDTLCGGISLADSTEANWAPASKIWQRAVAFVVACAVCNAVMHTFGWGGPLLQLQGDVEDVAMDVASTVVRWWRSQGL